MSILKKSILNVFDAYLYIGDVCVAVQRELTDSNMSQKATTTLIKNGRGNGVWSSVSSDKEVSIELKSNTFDFGLTSLQCGVIPTMGAGTFNTDAQVVTISGAKKITLSQTPLRSSAVQIVNMATDKLLASSEYTISALEVTFTTLTGVDVMVLPYEYSATSVEEIVIKADAFPSACRIVLKTVEVDAGQKAINNIEITAINAKPSSDFSISSKSAIGGMDSTIKFDCLKDNKSNLLYIRRTPIV